MYLQLASSIEQNMDIINKILYLCLGRVEYDYTRNWRLVLKHIETEICCDEKTKIFIKVELQLYLIAITAPTKCMCELEWIYYFYQNDKFEIVDKPNPEFLTFSLNYVPVRKYRVHKWNLYNFINIKHLN